MTLDTAVAVVIASAGGSSILQSGAIILGTFVLEDATTILTAMAVADGHLSSGLALGALYIGIVLGDLGLYGLGRLASIVPVVSHFLPPRRADVVRAWLAGRVFRVVLVSRFLPGVRLPAYTTCGFLGADLRRFLLAALLATSIWTTMLFTLSLHLGIVLIGYAGIWAWAGVAGIVLGLIAIGRVGYRLRSARL
jgi:membrane protein DedA with SNARE-associated domain